MTSYSLPFSDVFVDRTGGNQKTLKSDYQLNGKFPIIDQGQDFIGGYTDDTSRLCNVDLPVIIFGDHTKTFKYIDFPFCLGADGTKVLKSRLDADIRFLFYAIQKIDIPEAGYSRHFKFLKRGSVLFPSFDEQKRIAAILDQAEELKQKRQRSLELLDELKQAIFHDFIAAKQGKNWNSEKIGRLCKLVRGSSPRPKGDPRYYGGAIPRLMISDITRDGKYVFPVKDSLTYEGALLSRQMKKGEVVLAVSAAVGLPAILQVDACIHDGFVGFRELNDQIMPNFLYEYLLYTRVENEAKGAGAIWKNLTTDQVKSFDIKIPSLEEQKEILGKIERVESTRTVIKKSATTIDEFFNSLQHKAFSGELSGAA